MKVEIVMKIGADFEFMSLMKQISNLYPLQLHTGRNRQNISRPDEKQKFSKLYENIVPYTMNFNYNVSNLPWPKDCKQNCSPIS